MPNKPSLLQYYDELLLLLLAHLVACEGIMPTVDLHHWPLVTLAKAGEVPIDLLCASLVVALPAAPAGGLELDAARLDIAHGFGFGFVDMELHHVILDSELACKLAPHGDHPGVLPADTQLQGVAHPGLTLLSLSVVDDNLLNVADRFLRG